jgi:superfamily II DNA/RNA helicase
LEAVPISCEDLPQVPEDFVHRVGRTGRAGARGVASTFSTRGERGDIRRIERALNLRLTPREVAADLPKEQKPAAKVIPMRVDPKRSWQANRGGFERGGERRRKVR